MSRVSNGNTVGAECCCPKKVKFFIFGNTWINNYNAACPGLVPNGQTPA